MIILFGEFKYCYDINLNKCIENRKVEYWVGDRIL